MVVQASHAPSFQMVLGAFTKRTSAGSNWNEILDNGAYAVSNATTATGAPSGAYGWGTLVVTTSRDMGSYCGIVQLYFENTDEGIVWQRSKWLNTDEFRSWTKIITNIPSFYKNYSDLSSLASALGVFKFVNTITDDVLNCRHHGTYIVTKDAANRPTTDQVYYYMMTFKAHTENEMPCIAISADFGSMYFGAIKTNIVIWHKIALEQ